MPAQITCPSCGLEGHVPESYPLSELSCPRCGGAVAYSTGDTAPLEDAPAPGIDVFFSQAFEAPVDERSPSVSTGPDEVAPIDPDVERQWLQEERQRLEELVAERFAQVQQQREELAAWQSRAEAALTLRELEVNRKERLSPRMRAESADAALEEKSARLREEIAVQEALLEQRRIQVQHAEAERAALAEATSHHRASRDGAQAEWLHRVQQMERRQVALEKGEADLQRRLAELEQVELRIYRELEVREQELVRERRTIDQRWQQLNLGAKEKELLRQKVGELTAEIERLRQQVKTGRRAGA
ncbi:MAG: hypothetical protein K2R98_33960 [Gemmataceae bacterium]|nr:hypothetical protein [Gemmataceae bacterium]